MWVISKDRLPEGPFRAETKDELAVILDRYYEPKSSWALYFVSEYAEYEARQYPKPPESSGSL